MLKRMIALMLVLCMCLCLCVALASCKDDEQDPNANDPAASAGGSEQKGNKYTNPEDSSSGDVYEPIPEWNDPSWSYNY